MKRDMDLIRIILRKAEDCNDAYGMESPVIDGYSDAQVAYHIYLLIDGGLIESKDCSGSFQGEDQYSGLNLTSKGQDFVCSSRDDAIWKKATGIISKPGVAFTIDILLILLKKLAAESLGL